MWQKKLVWVVTAWFTEDENYSSPSEEYYANTLEEAKELKESLLEDCSIDDVWISDAPEEKEVLV